MTEQTRDYASILFTPEEAGVIMAQNLKMRRENKHLAIRMGLNSLDCKDKEGNFFLPLIGSEVTSIIARPGSGKTSFMVRWARYRAAQLRKLKMTNRVVVYVTLEQTVEELNAFNVAADEKISITDMATGEINDDEWKRCLESGIERRNVQLWNVGYSSITDKKQTLIDVDAINGAIDLIRTQHKKEIDLVFIDYLQLIPYNQRAESKSTGISDNLDMLKRSAMNRIKAPVVIGVQAKREVEDKPDPIPGQNDGEWTANIEKSSDKIISLVRPRKYRKEGEKFGSVVVEGHSQMLVSILKQKMGPANFSRWVYFDPIYNVLEELGYQRSQ